MFKGFRENMALFRTSKKHILIFELFYKLLAAAVIYPLVFMLVNVGMRFAGISYLTNEYILKTIVNPYVLAIAFLMVCAFVIYCVYEMSFMLASYEYKRRKADASFYVTAYSAFKKMRQCFHISNIPLMFVYIIFIFAINITVLANLVFTQTMRNLFQIHIINGKWYIKALLVAAFIIIYVIVFLGTYSFHVFFLEDKNFKEAYSKSSRMTVKHFWTTVSSIVLYNIGVLLFIGFVYGIISLFLIWGVKLLDMAYIGSAIYLSVLRNVRFAVKAILCCAAIPVSFLVITKNYYKLTNGIGIEFPLIYIKERFVRLNRIIYMCIIFGSVLLLTIHVGQSFNNNPFDRIAIFHQTEITAHRGSSVDAPENTLAAFQKAIDNMADFIELDVQMTSDNQIVIMHDNNTLRTTGVNGRIADMTLRQVKSLDAGSWFSEEFAGEKIPTLKEVLKLTYGKIKLNIEIKDNSDGIIIAEKVAKIIEEFDAENKCVVTSFDYASLKKVKECNQNIRVGYILSVAYGSFYEMDDVDFFSMNASFLTKRTVDAIHKSGKEVYAWTVNNEIAIKNLTNKGVDNIITDNPILAVETIYSRDTSETVVNMIKYVFNQ